MVLTTEYVDDISWCDYCGTYTPQSSAVIPHNASYKFFCILQSEICFFLQFWILALLRTEWIVTSRKLKNVNWDAMKTGAYFLQAHSDLPSSVLSFRKDVPTIAPITMITATTAPRIILPLFSICERQHSSTESLRYPYLQHKYKSNHWKCA